MRLIRRVARVMVAWVFVSSGLDVLRSPEGRADMAGPVLGQIRQRIPQLPADDVALVRMNSGVQIVAGALLAASKLPRVAALALVTSLVPTTVAGHPFWTIDVPGQRAQQRTQFNKNLAVLGGLVLIATEPRASSRRPG